MVYKEQAGALFSLEVMLLSFSWEKTLAAMMTSAIAASVFSQLNDSSMTSLPLYTSPSSRDIFSSRFSPSA
ncbi:hypothetical protein CG021_30145 [Klebsiella pneumoniae]|nr:hypothetical protein CG021_30145 [Klebsiella pneumoniae]